MAMEEEANKKRQKKRSTLHYPAYMAQQYQDVNIHVSNKQGLHISPALAAQHPQTHNVLVYWDYGNMPIPNSHIAEDVIKMIKQHISDTIGPNKIHFRLYTSCKELSPNEEQLLHLNGIQHIHIKTNDPNSSKCTLRLSTDIALKLFELEENKESKCIALISNHDDYAHLLSRIHKQPPISHLVYITFNFINIRFTNNVDFVIQCALGTTHNGDNTNTTMNTNNNNNNNALKRQRDCNEYSQYTTSTDDTRPPAKKQRAMPESIRITFKALNASSAAAPQDIICEFKRDFLDHKRVVNMRTVLNQELRKQLKEARQKERGKTNGKMKKIPKGNKPFLTYKSKRCPNKNPLCDYNFRDGDVIYWNRFNRKIKITFRHKGSTHEDTKKIGISTKDDFRTLYRELKSKKNFKTRALRMYPDVCKKGVSLVMFYKGREVEDWNASLVDYGIATNKDTLEWDYDFTRHPEKKPASNDTNTNTTVLQAWSERVESTMPSLERDSDAESSSVEILPCKP
eukprot:448897_1